MEGRSHTRGHDGCARIAHPADTENPGRFEGRREKSRTILGELPF